LTAPAQPLATVKPGLRARLDLPRRITQIAAGLVIALVALILTFITWRGIQLFLQTATPLWQILTVPWQPDPTSSRPVNFGLLPFIVGTLEIFLGAAIISAPLSVGLAMFMAEVAPDWARRITQPAMEMFVGIPSVVYGFLGLTVLVPFLKDELGFQFGQSMFAGQLVVAIMILPTITSLSYDAFKTVPAEMRSASLALGTTRWQAIRHVVLPAAASGVVTAIVMGMMRAAGEALAVALVVGGRAFITFDPRQPITTLTLGITADMGNTTPSEPWNMALWTMAVVLLLMSLGFVTLVRRLSGGRRVA
jgi:phosphate transport system permease protein